MCPSNYVIPEGNTLTTLQHTFTLTISIDFNVLQYYFRRMGTRVRRLDQWAKGFKNMTESSIEKAFTPYAHVNSSVGASL